MDLQRLQCLFDDIREELMRELIQSVMKQSNYDGLIAYGGLAATERLARRLALSAGVTLEIKRQVARMR